MTTFRPLIIRVTEREWIMKGKQIVFETVKNGNIIATYIPNFASERDGLIRFLEESGHHVDICELGQVEKPRHLQGRDRS